MNLTLTLTQAIYLKALVGKTTRCNALGNLFSKFGDLPYNLSGPYGDEYREIRPGFKTWVEDEVQRIESGETPGTRIGVKDVEVP